jgi:hypothetical protein
MQTEQWLPFFTHQSRHFMALTGHFSIPGTLCSFQPSSVLSPSGIDLLGQCLAHKAHVSQNF